jgi:hypothetical protein
VIGVQENFDSSQKRISRVQAVVTGLVGAEFRSATSDKTREALRLAFEQGFRVGGKIYGYDIVTTDVQYKPGMFRKRLVVNQTTAAVVRRIREMYADGNSLVGIATRLNNEAVPSAGANWKRTKRRADSKWLNSAVHAIIENPTYTGQLRNGQTYSHTLERRDDGLRMFVEPTEQVLERTDESLRIISQELWQRVRARQVKQSATAGEKVKEGLHKRARAGDCGRQRYLLSGMLRCGVCGGSFQMTNRTRYQCSSHHNGGDAACRVGLSVLRDRANGERDGYGAPDTVGGLVREPRSGAEGEDSGGWRRCPRGGRRDHRRTDPAGRGRLGPVLLGHLRGRYTRGAAPRGAVDGRRVQRPERVRESRIGW